MGRFFELLELNLTNYQAIFNKTFFYSKNFSVLEFHQLRGTFLANLRKKTMWRARVPDIFDSQIHQDYDRLFFLCEHRDFNVSPYILDEHIGHLAIWIVLTLFNF